MKWKCSSWRVLFKMFTRIKNEKKMKDVIKLSTNTAKIFQTAKRYFLVIRAQSRSGIYWPFALVQGCLLLTHKMLTPTITIPRRAQSHLPKHKTAPAINDCPFFPPSPNFQRESKRWLVTAKAETQNFFEDWHCKRVSVIFLPSYLPILCARIPKILVPMR